MTQAESSKKKIKALKKRGAKDTESLYIFWLIARKFNGINPFYILYYVRERHCREPFQRKQKNGKRQ